MEKKVLIETISEAERFVAAANLLLNDKNSWWSTGDTAGNKKSAAVRRASMDLTRKLSELRNNKQTE